MGSPLTLPGLSDLMAANFMHTGDIGSWTPPDPASGSQRNNVTQYSQAIQQSLGCDPMKGCAAGAATPPFVTPAAGAPSPSLNQAAGCDSMFSWLDPTCVGMKAGAAAGGTSASTPGTGVNTGGTLSIGRIAAFIGGLIFIAGGIYMLKGDTVISVGV